jgi:riboflavin kinase/FMN adenylyltransferase
MSRATAITIGNFDGVHAGHAALVRRCREFVGPSGRVVVLAFDPHPQTLLRPDSAPARIMPFERRSELLKELGADEIERLTPTRELLSLTAEEFVERKVALYAPGAIVEGGDFRFGKGRAGDVGTLAELGRRFAFEAIVVRPVDVALSDHQLVTASSTIIRWLLARGRAADAARVLGRPHEIAGTVIRGDRLGRTIGFPTANLLTEDLVPADGIYAALAEIPGLGSIPTALSIGTRPTFEGEDRRVEAYVLPTGPRNETASGSWSVLPGLPEYGWTLRLRVVAWIRDQVKFDSIGALVEQIERDCERVRERTAAYLIEPTTPQGCGPGVLTAPRTPTGARA